MNIMLELLVLAAIGEGFAIIVQAWQLRDLKGTMQAHLELHDKHERRYADER